MSRKVVNLIGTEENPKLISNGESLLDEIPVELSGMSGTGIAIAMQLSEVSNLEVVLSLNTTNASNPKVSRSYATYFANALTRSSNGLSIKTSGLGYPMKFVQGSIVSTGAGSAKVWVSLIYNESFE